MMQEYDDDFFFEEDKINSVDAAVPSLDANVLVPLENKVTVTAAPDNKQDKDDNILDFEADCIYNDLRKERYMIQYQDLLGMTVTSGSVTLPKDEKNLIGISIGGGAPLCPCLYVVQIFDNTPASKEGTLQSGDELVGVNGQPCKGKTKVEVAKMIQTAKEQVSINYNKLHADPKQGKTLDIILKKMKHRMVEKMSGGAADALGLSRAILCNDALVAKLSELRHTEEYYSTLLDHAKRMLKSYFDVIQSYKSMGDVFASIGVREPQARASEAFTRFGQYHRLLERDGIAMLKAVKPILADMGTYLHKAIPDTKLTIKKYADTKFEYLSYCLKVKEMDDEEHGFCPQEPFYRVETGNYEYRLILRCRQDARARFAQLRSDVLVKLELLENKKSQDVAFQLRRFIEGLAVYHNQTIEHLSDNVTLFPVEVDLSQNAFQYKSTRQIIQDEEDDIEYGKEIKEYHDLKHHNKLKSSRHQDPDRTMQDETEQLLSTEQPFATTEQLVAKSDQLIAMGEQLVAKSEQLVAKTEQLVPGLLDSDNNETIDNLSLLTELGLAEFGEFQDGNKNKNRNNDIDNDNDEFYEKLLSEICTR